MLTEKIFMWKETYFNITAAGHHVLDLLILVSDGFNLLFQAYGANQAQALALVVAFESLPKPSLPFCRTYIHRSPLLLSWRLVCPVYSQTVFRVKKLNKKYWML